MNKKVSTLLVATLLAAGPAFTAAYADITPVPYSATFKLNLADGVKFYLKGEAGKYFTAEEKTIDKQTVWTLGTTTESIADASVFEVRNFAKVSGGATFELYADGKKLVVSSETGNVVTELDKVISSFYSVKTTTEFDEIKTFAVNQSGNLLGGEKVTPFTSQLNYDAEDLKEYNAASTTFSFDFSDSELVGNEFKNAIPVTEAGKTYFVRGNGAKKFAPSDKSTYKDVEILAINPAKRYGLNTTNANEGYALYWMNAENALDKDGEIVADSTSLAGFTSLLEKDQLNNAGLLELKAQPKVDKNKDNQYNDVFTGADVKIAAVKVSNTDTKAYVTTVSTTATKWSVVKNAQLGDNTYLAASDFLKADAINTVSILVVNGKPGAGKYYNYVISTGSTVDYKAASELDFTMAQNQWVVTNFDGKYTLTLQNRLSGQVLTLRLAKTEAGYEVRSGLDQVLNEKNESVYAVVKFLGLETTTTDGYLKLTDEQIEKGVKLSFSGETLLAGEKEFFGVYNESANAMIPSFKADNSIVFYAVPNVDANKADKVAKDVTYACLNDKGEVTYKTAKANLVVPTYILATEFDKDGNVTKALGRGYNIESTATPTVVFAFAKNMNGTYSLTSQNVATTDVKTYAAGAVVGVKYNKDTEVTNPDGLEYTTIGRYDKDDVNNVFANVNILPNVILNASLPAVPGHYTFDNERGSINVTNIKGINEGALSSDALVFWLDTADIEKEVPSFYISYGIKGDETARQYMFNPVDSARVFDNTSANYKFNDVYFYGENADVEAGTPNIAKGTLKAAFTKAIKEEGKDLANAFKFNITLKDAAVADEYVLTTVSNGLNNKPLYVAQKNGVVILVEEGNDVEPMAFTVNPAEAPTSNETVSASEVKVVANNGSIVVKNAAGKNVVVSTILGQVVANEVLTSDNATINVPAGIVVVAVDGESFKVNVK